MARSPLLENFRTGKTSIGTIAMSPDMIDLCAHLGFDWVFIDQILSPFDFNQVHALITAAEAAGVTPVVRVQSCPWLGYDHRVSVDVFRLLSIGANFVLVSNSGKREIEECLSMAGDWHRKALWIHPFDSFEEWDPRTTEMEQNTFIIPHLESVTAYEEFDETLRLPGLKAFFFAMTDSSKVLSGGRKPDWYLPKLWDYVKRAVAYGAEHHIMIGANTSYAYDMDELVRRIKKLHDTGVRMIMVQSINFLAQVAVGGFLREVKAEIS
ncbi:MAG: aldolase/citrate lyase family protein [Armatimonadota bacterium]|nr:aldolase/citrate lyase family protein [Armatimonadota bacterium]MDR7459965.1 aldolase/citrate lyase family protein [Armatimonadota bacterium]MDR7479589.1 aldolase/citrate lyase family protein [Armatimonadota bacterium]MDR7490562.1 aldolase/citrate lyase family protein [Armatimonadota bacterium]MDR7526548.1 aldolase/citrate lyase family protein [Armatimonadota bacterium]